MAPTRGAGGGGTAGNGMCRPPRPWVLGATLALSALVVAVGAIHGEWRGSAITLIQVVAVGLAAYYGLR